ncbi:MAG TPA: hypothetical protein VMR86_16830 [Myxococcota bacterium]|nr:hypothetical protein [Myxococcota bacterium]
MKRLTWLAVAVFAMAGCAGITVEKQDEKNKTDGLHFFRPAPYLFTTLGKDGCLTEIVYLPDKNEEWVAIPHRGLGTAKSTVDLQDGWNLTSLNSETDSKVPETIEALTGVAKLAIPGAAAAQPGGPACATGLRALVWNGSSWGF